MKHHFGDCLNRDGGYWTIVPNRERYVYRIGDVAAGSREITIVTICRDDENWRRALSLPNLEELTLHEPTQEQLSAVGDMGSIKRLRITHARPRTVEFLRDLEALEELVLEYVSGFSDLAPLKNLAKLRAIHFENLRRVSDFSGLAGLEGLKYLAVYGTTDWKQPIMDFEFLGELPGLEELALWQVSCKSPYPALLPATNLRSLKRLRVHGSYLAMEEYALLEEALTGVEGADWGPYQAVGRSRIDIPSNDIRARLAEDVVRDRHPEVLIRYDGRRTIEDPSSMWFEFTGKGAGRMKCGSARAEQRCREYAEQYEASRREARRLIAQGRG